MSRTTIEPEISLRDQFIASYRAALTEHIRAHTVGTNVNTDTLLTTDYLNQFTAVTMLIELLPAAPKEIAEDLRDWQPVSYEQHFHISGFPHPALAIAAYRNAPGSVRDRFDEIVAELTNVTSAVISDLLEAANSARKSDLAARARESAYELRGLIQDAASIVNGTSPIEPDFDLEYGTAPRIPEPVDRLQSAVDSLFA